MKSLELAITLSVALIMLVGFKPEDNNSFNVANLLEKATSGNADKDDLNQLIDYSEQIDRDPAECRKCARATLTSSLKLGFYDIACRAENLLGRMDVGESNFIGALKHFNNIIDDAKTAHDSSLLSTAFESIGNVHYMIGEYDKSADLYNKALKIDEQYGNQKGIATLKLNLSNVYKQLGNPGKALSMCREALETFKRYNQQKNIAKAYNNIAGIYNLMRKTDSALYYHNKSLALKLKLGDTASAASTLNNIGTIYFDLNKPDSCRHYLRQSLEIKRKYSNQIGFAATITNLAELEITRKNYSQAKKYLDTALGIASQSKIFNLLTEIYQLYIRIEEENNGKTGISNYWHLYVAAKDSLNIERMRVKLAEIDARSQILKANQNLALLKNQENERGKQNTFLVIVIIMLAVIVLLILYAYIAKIKSNKKLMETSAELAELNSTKDKFFSIISHDLKNPLAAFINITEILKNNYNDLEPDDKQEFISSIYYSSKNLYALLENLLQWSRVQTGKIKFEPENFDLIMIVDNCISLVKLNSDKKEISIINQVQGGTMIYADRNMVYTVLRNFLTNAIKFTPRNGSITIYIESAGDLTKISVKDTGVGIAPEKIDKIFRIDSNFTTPGTENEHGTGLGLILAKEFAALNKGRIEVESKLGEGSTFALLVPTGSH